VADTTDSPPAGEDVASKASGAGLSRPRRLNVSWLGLVPFFGYVLLVFLVPIGFILFNAVRKTVQGPSHRDPVTQQFVHTSKTTFTGSNVSQSLKGIYRTDLITSVKLSFIVAIIGAVVGILLAYAVVKSGSNALRQIVTAAAAVTANFGGVPLAFLFIATLDANSGIATKFMQDHFHISLQGDLHVQLAQLSGLSIVYLYFLIPLMVLVMTPALEGLKPQWGEAAENLGANRWHYWRFVAGPVLLPNFLGSVLLLFCSSFSAYATAYAINSSFPLVTIGIASVLSGNVLSGQENLGAALALDMIVIVLPLTVIYQLLQRRTSKWLA
jgi:putative spermidine/putrescine transport system permease protein